MTIKKQIQKIRQHIYNTNLQSNKLLASCIHNFIVEVCRYNSDYNYINAYDDVLAMVGSKDISYSNDVDGVVYVYRLDANLDFYYNCYSINNEVDNDNCRFVDYKLTLDFIKDNAVIASMNDAVLFENNQYYENEVIRLCS